MLFLRLWLGLACREPWPWDGDSFRPRAPAGCHDRRRRLGPNAIHDRPRGQALRVPGPAREPEPGSERPRPPRAAGQGRAGSGRGWPRPRCGRRAHGAAARGPRAAPASTSRPGSTRARRERRSGVARGRAPRPWRRRPCWRTRSSGSSPSGRKANMRLAPGFKSGRTTSTARKAALRPALSPSKQRTGSGAMRQRSWIWSSVSAVPRGATVSANPASDRGDHVHVAFGDEDAVLVVGGLARAVHVEQHVALVEERGLRGVQIFGGLRGIERASPEGDDAAFQVLDREHDAVAEAVVGDGNVITCDQHTRCDHLLDGEAGLGKLVAQERARSSGHSRVETRPSSRVSTLASRGSGALRRRRRRRAPA